MSTVTNRPLGPNDPLYYAPKWALDGGTPQRAEKPQSNVLPFAADQEPHLRVRAVLERAAGASDGTPLLRQSPPQDPLSSPKPAQLPAARNADHWLKLFARIVLVAVVAQAAAVIAVGIPSTTDVKLPLIDKMMAGLSPAKPAAKSGKLEMPRLVGDGASGAVDEPLPLGVALHGRADDNYFMLVDVSADTELSAGKRININTWRLSIDELAKTLVVPPRGYSGPMDIVVDLRRSADNTMIGRRVLSMNWIAPKETAPPPPAAVPARNELPARQLDAEEIAGLLKRGEQLVVTGDLAGARLLLQRAAEAQNARAALALAATYDPYVLGKLGVYGFRPDAEKARKWYERAKAFGSPEAGKRLEQLAAQTR